MYVQDKQTPAERLGEPADWLEHVSHAVARKGMTATAAGMRGIAEELRSIAQQLEQQQQGMVSIPVEVAEGVKRLVSGQISMLRQEIRLYDKSRLFAANPLEAEDYRMYQDYLGRWVALGKALGLPAEELGDEGDDDAYEEDEL